LVIGNLEQKTDELRIKEEGIKRLNDLACYPDYSNVTVKITNGQIQPYEDIFNMLY